MIRRSVLKRLFRAIAIRLLTYSLIAYLTTGLFLYLRQDQLLFPVQRSHQRAPKAQPHQPNDLQIPVDRTGHLHARWVPATPPSGKVILVLHGNGEALEGMAEESAELHATGLNLLLIDYRGYGSSTNLTPNEETLDQDARAALTYLLSERHIRIGCVFVLGRSIGSGPAIQLASEKSGLAGLILQNPFTSLDDVAAVSWYIRLYPVSLMLRTHFDNLPKIGLVRVPLLLICGKSDTLTPAWMAEKIYARARQPKQLYLVEGAGHDDLLSAGGTPLLRALQKFVQ